jgi:periplasmic protein TonB
MHPAETSALPRRFSLSVVLSVALHSLAVAALGTFQFSPPVLPVQNQQTTVDLVALPPEPVVAPVAEPVVSSMPEPPKPAIKRVSVQKVHHKAVKRVSPRPAAPALMRARSATNSAAPPTAATVMTEPVAVESGPQPLFKDLPRVPAPASPPAMAFNGAAIFSVPESMEPPVLLNASAGSVHISRPLPAASSGGAKLLRDSTAEMGSVRSKVRAGNNPRPEYPRAAREAGWEGTVILQVLVLPDGSAGNITLHQTSGHSILDEAALSAVKNWRFIPAMDGNFPMQSAVHLPIRFDLKAAY